MAKKRANGEGTITKHKNGGWMATIMVDGERYWFYGKTQAEVKEKLEQAKEDLRKGINIKQNKLLFGDWLNQWVEEYAKPNISPTTYDSYKYHIRDHICPVLGNIKITQLQPAKIQNFYNQKLLEKVKRATKSGPKETNKTLSRSTVYKMHVIINSALDQAVKEGLIYRNPAEATKPPKPEKHEAQFLTPEQFDSFIKAISDDRWTTAFLFSLATGIRRGELSALKWENLNLEDGIVKITEGNVRVRHGVEEEGKKTKIISKAPKSKKSIREIPLAEQVVLMMRKWKEFQEQEKEYATKKKIRYYDNGYVFCRYNGKIVDIDFWTRHFKEMALQAGLKDFHLHNLRHSFVTWLLMNGESVKTVQELVGHASAAFMLDTYGHVIDEVKRAAAEKMGDMIGNVVLKKKPQE